MKSEELRAMVRESDRKPFRVCMDDGRHYTVSHPDFAMVADGALLLASGPGHELTGASFVICYFDHVSRVEMLKPRTKKAA
jgi:hypothetical protein